MTNKQRRIGDIGQELRNRHPLDHASRKAKLVRAIRELAHGKSYGEYLAVCSMRKICDDLDLQVKRTDHGHIMDHRVIKVFQNVEREIFGVDP